MRLRQRQPRVHDDAHRKFLGGLLCCVCLDNTSVEAAHVRYAEARAAKPFIGKSEKAHDRFCVPLCSKHHRKQHDMNEESFWSDWVYAEFGVSIDPVYLALALHSVSGDHAAGEQIIRAYH